MLNIALSNTCLNSSVILDKVLRRLASMQLHWMVYLDVVRVLRCPRTWENSSSLISRSDQVRFGEKIKHPALWI